MRNPAPRATLALLTALLTLLCLPLSAATGVQSPANVTAAVGPPDGGGGGDAPGLGQRPGHVNFRGAAFPIGEEAGEVEVIVQRNGGTQGDVSVAYETFEGTATAGEDYEPTDGVLEWADGERGQKSFFVTIYDDDLDEGQETFGVVLSEPTGDLELRSPATTTVRIKPSDRSDGGDDDEGDDEPEAGVLKLTRENYVTFETSGKGEFSVERDDGTAGAVSVEYMTVDGSATDPEDYAGVSGILEWADGEDGEKTVEFDVFDDTEEEGTETVTVLLTSATGGAELGRRDTASVQIIDDDAAEGDCVPDDETLCLNDGRFQVTGTWTDFEGNSGPFHMVPTTDDAGFAWFFDEDNLELLMKLLDACDFNGHFWFFYAASTNVGFDVVVSDLVSGEERTYTNELGVVAETVTDTTAFGTCGE